MTRGFCWIYTLKAASVGQAGHLRTSQLADTFAWTIQETAQDGTLVGNLDIKCLSVYFCAVSPRSTTVSGKSNEQDLL